VRRFDRFEDRGFRFRQLAGDDRVDQAVLERLLRVEIEIGALGVLMICRSGLPDRDDRICRSDPASASGARDAAPPPSSTASPPTSPARES
jgi:hypothetical protein